MNNIKNLISFIILLFLIIITYYTFLIDTCKNPSYLLQYDGAISKLFPAIFTCVTLSIFLLLFRPSSKNFTSEIISFSFIIFIIFNFITLYNGDSTYTIKKLFFQIIHSRFTAIQFLTIASLYTIFLLYIKTYARLLIFCVFFILACIDYGKRCFFNDHLYIEDFYLIDKDFLEVIIPFTKEYTNTTIIILFCILFVYSIKKNYFENPKSRIKISIFSITFLILSVFSNYIFIFEKNYKNFFVIGYSWYYTETGFITGFINNILFSTKTKSLYFSEKDIHNTKNYLLQLKQNNNTHTHTQSTRPNIIIWQEESYDDLRKYPSFRLPQTTYDKYDRIIKESSYGDTLNPQYYTINSQFEFMSGLFYKYFNPEMAIYTKNKYPLKFSIGYALQKNGYTTGSLHKYFPSTFNTKTKNNESLFGITESFKLENTNKFYEKTSYISSMNYVQETLKIIKNHYSCIEKPFALFVQTDQNHTPHTLSNLNSTPKKSFIEGKYDENLSVYAHGIESSNDAIFFLINELKKLKTPTVLLFYGDHNAHVGEKDIKSNILDKNTTSFFIWSNYKTESIRYVTTSHTYLGIHLFEYIGLPMNRYQLFMNKMQNYCRGINTKVSLDKNGNIFTIDENNFFIKTQQVIQYDTTSGKNLLSDILSEIPH